MTNSIALALACLIFVTQVHHRRAACPSSGGRRGTFAIHDGVWYDVGKAWCLMEGAPVERVPMRDLVDLLHVSVWNRKWSDYTATLTAADVLQQPWAFPGHMKRIAAANLSYPILVVNEPIFPGFAIADGNHRLARAYMENYTIVAIQRVPPHLLAEARLDDSFGYD